MRVLTLPKWPGDTGPDPAGLTPIQTRHGPARQAHPRQRTASVVRVTGAMAAQRIATSHTLKLVVGGRLSRALRAIAPQRGHGVSGGVLRGHWPPLAQT